MQRAAPVTSMDKGKGPSFMLHQVVTVYFSHTCAHAYKYTHTHSHTLMCMHAHTHKHTYTHLYFSLSLSLPRVCAFYNSMNRKWGFDKCSPLARCRSFRHDIFTCVSGRNFKFALKCPEKIQEIMRDNSNKSEKNIRFVFWMNAWKCGFSGIS